MSRSVGDEFDAHEIISTGLGEGGAIEVTGAEDGVTNRGGASGSDPHVIECRGGIRHVALAIRVCHAFNVKNEVVGIEGVRLFPWKASSVPQGSATVSRPEPRSA